MIFRPVLNTRSAQTGIELFDEAGVVHYRIAYDRTVPSLWHVTVMGPETQCRCVNTGMGFYSSQAAEYACLAHFLETRTQRRLRVIKE